MVLGRETVEKHQKARSFRPPLLEPGRRIDGTNLGVSLTADQAFIGYRVRMKGLKIPHLRLAKPYPPTFGCSVCPATFEGPKGRKGLAKEFADHVRREHRSPNEPLQKESPEQAV